MGWVFSPGACVFCPGGFSFEIGDGNKQLTLLCHTTLLCAFPPRCPREARCGRLVSRSSIFYIFFNSSPAIYDIYRYRPLFLSLLRPSLYISTFFVLHSLSLTACGICSLVAATAALAGFRFPAPVSGSGFRRPAVAHISKPKAAKTTLAMRK